jgi:hypothetical protein
MPPANSSTVPITPLPKIQIFTLMLIQLSEPIVCKVIFPFVNQFVRETGITGGDERKTGYYGGTVDCSSVMRSHVADSRSSLSPFFRSNCENELLSVS